MDMEFRGLLTDCMEHSPSLEASWFLASQGIPCILWNITFITAFYWTYS